MGHKDVVALLLSQGVEINAQNFQLDTALSKACLGGHLEVADLLIKAGADLELGNPLLEASRWGHQELVRLLEKAAENKKASQTKKKTEKKVGSVQSGSSHTDQVKSESTRAGRQDPSELGAVGGVSPSQTREEEEVEEEVSDSEGGPQDRALKKFAKMIEAKAKAELEHKMKSFKKLQEENEEIQRKLRVKEEEYENQREAETELMNNQAKTRTKHLEDTSKTEEEKLEKAREVNNLEQEIQELEGKIRNKKEQQQVLTSDCKELDSQIETKEKKRLKYEKFMNSKLGKAKLEKDKIMKEMEELKESLQENMKATEDLVRLDEDVPIINPGQSGIGEATRSSRAQKESYARMVDFLIKSIQEKEAKLECPVCLATAEAPIYMCPESHLIW